MFNLEQCKFLLEIQERLVANCMARKSNGEPHEKGPKLPQEFLVCGSYSIRVY